MFVRKYSADGEIHLWIRYLRKEEEKGRKTVAQP
jgi:hypothetical protein